MFSSTDIKTWAQEAKFDLCGIAPADSFPELRYIDEWIRLGYAGEMSYLARSLRRRADVRHVVPAAKSVVMLGTVYNTDYPYSTESDDQDAAVISRYAWGRDYHSELKRRTETLLDRMRMSSDQPFEARCYVDTGPVQERIYAQYAGLGWIGKNTCLIHPEKGSWLFLSEIITSLSLEPDLPQLDQCGNCSLCLEACPTNALREPYVLDSTRCLSYLTIELRGPIPKSQRSDIGTYVYGCDICQDVCPYNASPAKSTDPVWQPRPAFDKPTLEALWKCPDDILNEHLEDSAMSRAGVTGLRRNIAVALGNSATSKAREIVTEKPGDETPSKRDPVVVDHLQWAKQRLARSLKGRNHSKP